MTKRKPCPAWGPEEERHIRVLQERYSGPTEAFKVYQQEAEHPRTWPAFCSRWTAVKKGRMAAEEVRIAPKMDVMPKKAAPEEVSMRFEDDEEAARPAKTRFLALATHTRGNAGKSYHWSDAI